MDNSPPTALVVPSPEQPGPVLWLLVLVGFVLLVGRAVVYLLGGPRLWF